MKLLKKLYDWKIAIAFEKGRNIESAFSMKFFKFLKNLFTFSLITFFVSVPIVIFRGAEKYFVAGNFDLGSILKPILILQDYLTPGLTTAMIIEQKFRISFLDYISSAFSGDTVSNQLINYYNNDPSQTMLRGSGYGYSIFNDSLLINGISAAIIIFPLILLIYYFICNTLCRPGQRYFLSSLFFGYFSLSIVRGETLLILKSSFVFIFLVIISLVFPKIFIE